MISDVRHDEPWIRFLLRLGIEPQSIGETGCLCMCPFHGDVGTASLSVSEEGKFHCFSAACGVQGGGFVPLARKAGFKGQAGIELVSSYGLEPYAPSGGSSKQKPTEPSFVPTGRYHVDWADMWQSWCRATPPKDIQAAPSAAWLFRERRIAAAALEHLQVGVDRETGDVVFPQYAADSDGYMRCVGLSRRGIQSKVYLTKFEKRNHLWGLPPDPRVSMVLVEGQMDALRIRSADIMLGTCTYGAQLSAQQYHLAKSHPGGVVLFMDNDAAGVAATGKALAAIGPYRCRVVTDYHGVKDAGDMTDEQIVESLSSAVSGEEYVAGPGQRHRMRLLKGGG